MGMKKRKVTRIITLMLACVMVFTPTASQAKNDLQAIDWIKDKETGKRTGLASVMIDDVSYFDLYGGSSDNRTRLSSQIRFLQDVLTTEYEDGSVLDTWAELALAIWSSEWDYAHLEDSNNYLRYGPLYLGSFSATHKIDQSQWVQWLTESDKSQLHSPNSDGSGYAQYATGLQYATSLSAVRDQVIDIAYNEALLISKGLENSKADNNYHNVTKSVAQSGFDNNGILSELNDDSINEVYYTIMDLTDYGNAGKCTKYINNNLWGIAFYDFQLQVIANDELPYITAAEGYNDLEDAADAGVPGVTYTTSGNDNDNLNYYQNRATAEAEVGMEFTQSTSMSISNSMEESSTYTYSKMLGSETKLGSSILGLVSLEETFTADFTTEEAVSTAYSEETTATQETSSTTSTSMSLPAQTAVSIESSTGTTTATLEYDCPVAVSYKVCVFSCSPQWYGGDHKEKNTVFEISNYSSLVTKFGTDTTVGGLDARENLYNRAITYSDMQSYDSSYGQVTGIYRGDDVTLDYLDWSKILKGEISEGDLDRSVPIYVDVFEVNTDGDTAIIGDLIDEYEYDNRGYVGYTTEVDALNSYEMTGTDDQGNEISICYDLYTGPVYDEDGNNVNADLETDEDYPGQYWTFVTPTDSYASVSFYYTLREDEDEPEPEPTRAESTETTEPTEPDEQPQTISLSALDAEEPADAELPEGTAVETPIMTEEATGEAEPETVPETAEEEAEFVEPEEAAVEEAPAEPEEAAVEEAPAEPEEAAAEEAPAEPEEAAVEEAPAEPEEVAAEEAPAEPEEAAAEEIPAGPEEAAVEEAIEEPEEAIEIAEYAAAPESEEIVEEEEPVEAEPVADEETSAPAEVYEAPSESYDEIIVEDGDLIGSVSNGGTVAGIDSNGSYEPSLTIESIEVVDSADIPEELQDGEDIKEEPQENENAVAEQAADSAVMPLAVLGNITGIDDDVKWIVGHVPMSVSGATLNIVGKTTTSEIYDMVAVFPLDYTSVTSDQKTFDMITGTTINVDNIEVGGFNKNNVEYYGFDQDKGYWVLVDEDGNVLEDSSVASLSTNSKTGVTLLSADGEGTVYLDYMIDENAGYTYMDGDDDPATNEKMSSVASVQINVANGPFEGTVVASGTLTGYANDDEAINLDTADGIDVEVYDEHDKKIYDAAITWEAQKGEQDGIILEDNRLSFTKAGTYKIRAVYGYSSINTNPYSDWIEVTALPEKKLDVLTIKDTTSPATLSDIILGDGKESVNLGWLSVSAVDQYKNDWTKLDDLTWYVDGTAVGSGNGSCIYTATKAGTHKVYAMSHGVKSNELTLTVNAARKLSTLKISDTTSPKTLVEVTYGEGKEEVDLSKLTISGTDQYGDKWTDLSSLKWYVDDQALTGSVYTVKNTSAGTHSIYAQSGSVKSNKLSISAKVPATSVKLNKESLEIKDDKTKQLKATMAPTGTTDTITWTSSKTSVATVSSDGTVTAVSPGTATITAKTTSGESATCQVHVVYKKGETFSKGAYNYKVKDSSTDGTGTVTMAGFAEGKSKKKLTVPDTVTIKGTTYKVTAIADEAFKGNSKIKSFTSGANLTTIGTSAFENCKNLKTVTIGNSVKKINFKAFYDCYKLQDLTIGKNVNFMGAHCFCNDSNLKTITIKSTKLKKKNVESPHVFINVNDATMKVPKSKYQDYKKLFKAREYGGKITKKKQ